MRNYHQFVAESIRPGQSHDLWEETLKARSSIARSKARVLVAIPGARELTGQYTALPALEVGAQPTFPSPGCVPELLASALDYSGCRQWQSDTLGAQDRLGTGQRRSKARGRSGQEGAGAVGTGSSWRGGDPAPGKPCGCGSTTPPPPGRLFRTPGPDPGSGLRA